MAGSAAEAKFGIVIEGTNRSRGAFEEAQRSTRDLTAQTERLKLVSQGATDAMAQQAGAAGGLVRSLAAIGSPLGLAVAGFVALGAATVVAARGIADYQEKLDIAAATTGLTSDEISGLSVAASNAGQSFEQVRPALDFFTRRIGDAANGSKEANAAFTSLGVSFRDLNGQVRPVGEVLRDVQTKLNAIQDPTDKASKAFDVFGRSGVRSLGVLTSAMDDNIAAAQGMGNALDEAGKIAARHADTSFDRLNNAMSGIGTSLGSIAAQAANPFVDSLSKAAEAAARFVHDPNVNDMMKILRRMGGAMAPGASAQQFNLDAADVAENAGANFKKTTGPTLWSGLGSGALNPFAGAVDLISTGLPELTEAQIKAEKATEAFAEQVEKINRSNFPNFLESILSPRGARGFDRTEKGLLRIEREARAGGGMADDTVDAITTFKKDEANRKTNLEAAKRINEDMLRGLTQTLVSGWTNFITTAITGVGSLKNALNSMVQGLLQTLVQAGVKAGLKSLIPGIGAFLQSGGSLVHAQSGVIASGMRGIDSNLIAAGYGETMIVDHSTTDGLRLLVPQLARFVSESGGRGQTQIVTNHFNVTVEADFTSPDGMQDFADKLVPAIDRAIRYRTYKRVA